MAEGIIIKRRLKVPLRLIVKGIGQASATGVAYPTFLTISYSDVVFNPNWIKGTVKGRLCVVMAVNAGTGYVRLWKQFAASAVAGSLISITSTSFVIVRSDEFTDFVDGNESYQLQLSNSATANTTYVDSAFLEIWVE